MIIDYHTHFMQRAHFGPEFTREWDARGGTGAWPEITPEQYEEALKPVDRAIVFGITAHALGVETPHEYVAGLVARNPRKYIGFMALDPSRPDAIRSMEQGRGEFGLRGIKLYPVMSLYNLTDAALGPFFRRAEELGLPILTHMGTSPATRGLLKYSLPLLIDEVAVAFPKLKIIMAHLGHPWQRDAAMVIRKHANVYADISGLWHRPWQGYEALVVCQEWGVTDKLLFGSDYPLWQPGQAIEGLRKLNDQVEGTPLPPISREVIEGILQRNVLKELGIES
ncbi:MAG: amidohydrolase family protein [Acidobacteria bacterium]|nr:amidohydrolase family protein [Acidobacteriota bacterium]